MPKSPEKDSRQSPTYQEEADLLSQGYQLIAGVDEVGRGPLAGPVVAGIVILPLDPKESWVSLVRDSKQLTPSQRDYLLPFLEEASQALAVGESSPTEIDEIGIVRATKLAMKRAIDSLPISPQFLLIDALLLPDIHIPQKAIIRGDASCLSIAAASIVAKVTRDRYMMCEDTIYPQYGFARHKGYGTAEHLRNLKRLGPTPIHRYSFTPIKEMVKKPMRPMVGTIEDL